MSSSSIGDTQKIMHPSKHNIIEAINRNGKMIQTEEYPAPCIFASPTHIKIRISNCEQHEPINLELECINLALISSFSSSDNG
mmetsp:Transcript_23415/g.35597  ORF Transcript_23415/g.35597 Transcript_23415/m.35597 type:complete len:83 (+) Transcript_23415:567-815(+)